MTQHDWEMIVLGDNLGKDSNKKNNKKSTTSFLGNCIAFIVIMLFIFAFFCRIFNITITDILASLYNLNQAVKGVLP